MWIRFSTCSGLVFTQCWPCKDHQPVVVVLTNEWAAYDDGLASAQQGGATGGLPQPQRTKTLLPFIWTPLRAAEKQEWGMLALAICQDHMQLWAASQRECIREAGFNESGCGSGLSSCLLIGGLCSHTSAWVFHRIHYIEPEGPSCTWCVCYNREECQSASLAKRLIRLQVGSSISELPQDPILQEELKYHQLLMWYPLHNEKRKQGHGGGMLNILDEINLQSHLFFILGES